MMMIIARLVISPLGGHEEEGENLYSNWSDDWSQSIIITSSIWARENENEVGDATISYKICSKRSLSLFE